MAHVQQFCFYQLSIFWNYIYVLAQMCLLCIVTCHTTGQKSLQCLVHILGETTTSYSFILKFTDLQPVYTLVFGRSFVVCISLGSDFFMLKPNKRENCEDTLCHQTIKVAKSQIQFSFLSHLHKMNKIPSSKFLKIVRK